MVESVESGIAFAFKIPTPQFEGKLNLLASILNVVLIGYKHWTDELFSEPKSKNSAGPGDKLYSYIPSISLNTPPLLIATNGIFTLLLHWWQLNTEFNFESKPS